MPIPRAGQHRADKPATEQAVAQVAQACSAQARPIAQRLHALVLQLHPGAHILYYLGGMIAIGAMTLFMTLGWRTRVRHQTLNPSRFPVVCSMKSTTWRWAREFV